MGDCFLLEHRFLLFLLFYERPHPGSRYIVGRVLVVGRFLFERPFDGSRFMVSLQQYILLLAYNF
jgi:hypothetical protein